MLSSDASEGSPRAIPSSVSTSVVWGAEVSTVAREGDGEIEIILAPSAENLDAPGALTPLGPRLPRASEWLELPSDRFIFRCTS